MSKEAYYFSHDANARHDPKILAMRSDYGVSGYGVYWIIIEMLREENEYKLPMKKYIFNAIAMQVQCKDYAKEDAKQFVDDCINEYELFESDDDHFWSNSLLSRMEKKNVLSEKRKEAANKRWNKPNGDKENGGNDEPPKKQSNASAMQKDAIAMQSDARKGNKGNEIKEMKVNQLKEMQEPKKEPQKNPMVDDGLKDVVQFYESNFGMMPAMLFQVLPDDYDRFGKELMIEAMQRAVLANAKNYAYVLKILNNWESKNVHTMQDVVGLDTEFANQKQRNGPSYGRKPKEEKVPEWFEKHKATRGKGEIVEADEVDEDYLEAKRELLKKLGVKEGVDVE